MSSGRNDYRGTFFSSSGVASGGSRYGGGCKSGSTSFLSGYFSRQIVRHTATRRSILYTCVRASGFGTCLPLTTFFFSCGVRSNRRAGVVGQTRRRRPVGATGAGFVGGVGKSPTEAEVRATRPCSCLRRTLRRYL